MDVFGSLRILFPQDLNGYFKRCQQEIDTRDNCSILYISLLLDLLFYVVKSICSFNLLLYSLMGPRESQSLRALWPLWPSG